MTRFYVDLHVHTSASPDGYTSPETVLRRARNAGLDGVAITDHDHFDPARHEALRASTDLLLVPGQEVTSTQGHILAYFIDSEIKSFRPPKEIIDDIHHQAGLAVAAHPFRLMDDYDDDYFAAFDAVENFNARSGNPEKPGTPNHRTRQKLTTRSGLGRTGGSDSHLPWTVGNGHTVFDTTRTLSALKNAILNGSSETGGTPSYQFNRALSKGRFLMNHPEMTVSDWLNYVPDCARWIGSDIKTLVKHVMEGRPVD